MPEIMMEIMCMVVLTFIAVLYGINKRMDRTNPVHAVFRRLLVMGLINIMFETLASYALSHEDTYPVVYQVVFFELFYISLLFVLYEAFIYMKGLMNSDLPPLRKIGRWSHYLVGVMLGGIGMLPLTFITVEGNEMRVNGKIAIAFIILVAFIIFLGGLEIASFKFINTKRRKILMLGFLVEAGCIVFQLLNLNTIVAGMGVTLLIMSFYMTLEDEDVRMIEQLAIESRKADQANRAKTDFIANVSHEIRTPINAVLGMDEMILRQTEEESTRQYAIDIRSAAQTLHGIINEILDLSKMETGKMEIIPVNYDMRALLYDTLNIVKLKLESKHLELNVRIDPNIPSGYHGDETRIKQILNNILSNAVKYTERGSVSIVVSGEHLADKKEKLHFKISDTGIGMRQADLENLFEDFRRFDSEKNRHIEGTGLGMPITMQLLQMMGSTLNAESEYGKGSVFCFDLIQPIWDESPIGVIRKDTISSSEDYQYTTSFEAPDTRVLVVDDNAINRKVFTGLLKDTKLIIDEAESGPKCLEMISRNKYKIVFMDHMMPDMDGIETFRRMKKMENNMSKDAIVIMLTANAVLGARELYLEEGFDDFIAKPIVSEKLEEMIRKYIYGVKEET